MFRSECSYKSIRFGFLIIAVVLAAFVLFGCASGNVQTQKTTVSYNAGEPNDLSTGVEFISYSLHRYALVIGNGNYEEGALANPKNDAALMADKLSNAGFDVYRYFNLKKGDMDDAVSSFVKVVNNDAQAIAVVYYAGHGVEVEGVNYLIPIDNAKIESEEDVKIYAYSLDNILSLLNAKEQIIILDACRNNPYRMSGDRAAGVKGGLGALKEAKKGVSMSYLFAAQSGQTAKDGEGGNSVFTAILAEEIEKGNVPISQLFNSVASRVKAMTNGEQVPLSSTTGSDFVFQSEDLAKAVLAKWSQQLKQAEADLKKLESSKSSNDSDKATELAAAQAKLALAQAEKEASEKRTAQIKADAEKAAQEAEAAKNRSAELQEKIDQMKIDAENMATTVRLTMIIQNSPFDTINDIEDSKVILKGIIDDCERAVDEKCAELTVEYALRASEIDNKAYQKAELDSDGRPTTNALMMREMQKEKIKDELENELYMYSQQITSDLLASDTDIKTIISSKLEMLDGMTYNISSVLGSMDVTITQYNGASGGWTIDYQASDSRFPFSGSIFLSYEQLTGLIAYKTVSDYSQMEQYQEYLDNVDMFDSLFRSDTPILQVSAQFIIQVGSGSLQYFIVPQNLEVKRVDTNQIIVSMDKKQLSTCIINSSSGINSGTALETKKQPITTTVMVHYNDIGNVVMKVEKLVGLKAFKELKQTVLSEDSVIELGYSKEYKVGDRGPSGGWVFYDKGKSTDGWRYLETAPGDISRFYGSGGAISYANSYFPSYSGGREYILSDSLKEDVG